MNRNIKGPGEKLKLLATVFLPILAVIVPVAIYMTQIEEKTLAYEISSYSLVNEASSIKDDIEINYLGKKVDDLSVINIKIENAGDIPIKKEDYERDIAIGFGQDAQILKTSLGFKSPSNLAPQFRNDSGTLYISPLLLNSRDKFSVEVIVSKPDSDLSIDARVAGIKAPVEIAKDDVTGSYVSNWVIVSSISIFAMMYSFLAFIAFVAYWPEIRKRKLLSYKLVGAMAILAAIASSFYINNYTSIDFSKSFLLEFSLYFAALIFGMWISNIATTGLRTNLSSEKEVDKD